MNNLPLRYAIIRYPWNTTVLYTIAHDFIEVILIKYSIHIYGMVTNAIQKRGSALAPKNIVYEFQTELIF